MEFKRDNVYDLIEEGQKVRDQLEKGLNPVVEARNMMSQTILANILLALSDSDFYTYLNGRSSFNMKQAAEELKLDSFVFEALIDYLVGRGFFNQDGDRISLTKTGTIFFNAYTRGLCNVYLGGYKSIFYYLSDILNKKIPLNDSLLSRSSYHAAKGTGQLTCVFTIPQVLKIMDAYNTKCILDLGCGTGDFLVHIAQLSCNNVSDCRS